MQCSGLPDWKSVGTRACEEKRLHFSDTRHRCRKRIHIADCDRLAGVNQGAQLIATGAVFAGIFRTLLHRAVRTTAAAAVNSRTILVRGANSRRADEIRHAACKQDDNNHRGNEMAKSQQHTSHVRFGHSKGQGFTIGHSKPLALFLGRSI